MFHFARGFALSAEGKLTDAQAELKQLQSAAAAPWLKEQKIFDLNSLAQLAAISSAMLQGEIAAGRGEHAKAITAFHQAVELEDALLYSEPPDWSLPPRQYLAAEYLKAGRTKMRRPCFAPISSATARTAGRFSDWSNRCEWMEEGMRPSARTLRL